METKILARMSVLIALLLLPLSAIGSGVLSIDDSIAGLGLEIRMRGFEKNQAVDVVIAPPSGEYEVLPMQLNVSGNLQTHTVEFRPIEAGTYSAFVGKSGKRIGEEIEFQILPDAVDAKRSTLEVSKAHIIADGEDAVTARVTLKDRYGNPLPGRPVKLISGQASTEILEKTRETNAQGVQEFTVTTVDTENVSLRALDLLSDTLLDEQRNISVEGVDAVGGYRRTGTYDEVMRTGGSNLRGQLIDNADAAPITSFDVIEGFDITLDPDSLEVNDVANVMIKAIDRNNKTVEDYTGTVRIYSPTDPTASVPGLDENNGFGRVTFTARNLGRKFIPLSVSFKKPGTHTLRVEDSTNNKIRGEVTVVVTGEGPSDNQRIKVISPAPDGTVSGPTITIEGQGLPYTNIRITGGTNRVDGDTDGQGNFAIPVPIDQTYNEYTFSIRDDAGNEASLHVVRDTDSPVILSAAFTPERPEPGVNTVLVVQSEPNLPEVKMTLGEQDFVLQPDASKLGTYQLLFVAPVAGSYQPVVKAKDGAGNTAQMIVQLVVNPRILPKIGNIRAKPSPSAVDLSWDPVTSEQVEKYRVYIGEAPDNFSSSIDTEEAHPEVRVSGLTPGTTYYFAITAVQGSRESTEKSDIVSARPLGLRLTVAPSQNSLLLKWAISAPLSVSMFQIDYGVEQGQFTEKRIVPGGDLKADEERNFTMRDLLPNVTYYVKITPIATTGDPMRELSAESKGKPLSTAGFHPSAGDPLPIDPTDIPPSNDLHGGAPNVPSTGIPSFAWWLAGSGALLIGLLQWRHKQANRRTHKFLRAMEARYRT